MLGLPRFQFLEPHGERCTCSGQVRLHASCAAECVCCPLRSPEYASSISLSMDDWSGSNA